MKNNIYTEKHFSDAITNFNLCDNSFISNNSKNSKESVTNFLFNDIKVSEEIKLVKRPNMNREEVDTFYTNNFRQQIKNSKEADEKKKMKIIEKNNFDEIIRQNSFKQYFMINKMHESPEYKDFKERVDVMNKRINIIMGFASMYSLYILNNIYESKIKSYDKINDLIMNTPRQIQKVNFTLHITIITTLVGLGYYCGRKNKKLQAEFQKVIREKYFDENFDFSQIKIVLDNYKN